jgi:peptidoglycan/xylan/chitin deacetylase (PgdA/CDA1 family)
MSLSFPAVILLTVFIIYTAAGCGAVTDQTAETTTVAITAAPSETTAPAPSPTPEPTPTPAPQPPSADSPAVALTFDDGPSLRDTGALLDLLKQEKVPATFFVLGSQIELGREDLVRRAWEEGHEIGNHTFSHTILSGLGIDAVTEELSRTNDIIESITGRAPNIMRPPTGSYDSDVEKACGSLGLAIVNWDWKSCPEDWNYHDDPEHIANHVIANAANGNIILLHDTNEATMAAMPEMIAGLKARGFRFMTVSELLAWQGENHPVPGSVYFSYSVE